MHLFMEGVISYELQFLLYHCIFIKAYFRLKELNRKILNFNYCYLDKINKPEPISRLPLVDTGKISQTAAAMVTLCITLPLITCDSIPQGDERCDNFIFLIKIMLLSISPYVNVDTIDLLKMMINIHHTKFKQLYPKSSITLKMHYIVHLPEQMLTYGPLRNVWCMRLEAKHNFFKSKKWQCFKNVPMSLATYRQKAMCHKQCESNGQRNASFLYSGYQVKVSHKANIQNLHPDLVADFTSYERK